MWLHQHNDETRMSGLGVILLGIILWVYSLNMLTFELFYTILGLSLSDQYPMRMKSVLNTVVSLNSIYFQISIYTWQHTSIQIHGKWI